MQLCKLIFKNTNYLHFYFVQAVNYFMKYSKSNECTQNKCFILR